MKGLRHELLEELGRGGQAQTWRGRDRASGALVAVKELSLSSGADFKAIELFEREAAVLRHLEHPAIPRYVDAYHEGQRCFLVQELVEGRTLAARLEEEGRLEVDEVLRIAREVLDILVYLHGFSPPVVHRDIKPSNLMERADGSIALIDFGGVQTVLHDDVGGSTIIGTDGYAAPEQLMGRAQPASDLYGLGATMVHLLTGVSPAELPQARMRPVWRDRARAPAWLADVVDRLLEPAAEERYASATALRAALEPEPVELPSHVPRGRRSSLKSTRYRRPSTSDVELRVTDRSLTLYVPGRRFLGAKLVTGTFFAVMAVAGVMNALQMGWLGWIGAILILSAGLPWAYLKWLRPAESGVRMTLTRGGSYRATGRDLGNPEPAAGPLGDVHGTEISVHGKTRLLILSTAQGLVRLAPMKDEAEERWLRSEIDAFLNEPADG